LTISAEAVDDQFVEAISVNDQEIPVDLSGSAIAFHTDIRLKRGENKIMAQATDLVGRQGRQEIVVWCDQEAPVVYIDRIAGDDSDLGYTIEGYVADTSGVAGFWLNGFRVDLSGTTGGEFSMYLHTEDMKSRLFFKALDGLGNGTSGEIMIADAFGIGHTGVSYPPRLAYSGNDLRGMVASQAEGVSASTPEDSGPVIRLKDLPERITVDWDECFLEGEARDHEGIRGVSVNGVPLATRTARVVFFNFLVPLAEGENVITVQAESLSGKVRTTKVLVERNLNEIQRIGARLNMAVFPFKYMGERKELQDLLYNAIIQGFVEQHRFQIVDRERVDDLLARIKEEEHGPSSVELGRLVTAEAVIAGSAYFFDDYLEIIARVVDTETSAILDAEEVFGPVSSLKDAHLLAQGLSLKFKQAFPLVEGGVVSVLPDAVQIDLGRKDRILPYMKIIFFREDQPVNIPGSERISERRFTILGEGRIKKLYESTADAVLVLEKSPLLVEVDDRVITK
jgi:TolB-like protein